MLESTVHPRVMEALHELNIDHEVVPCDPALADTAAFCSTYGFPLETSANAILVAATRGPECYSLGVVPATQRLDINHKVRQLMGVARASFAKPEQTIALTGMPIGGVTPLGMPPNIPIYFEETLLRLEYVIIGSGTRSSKIKLGPEELMKIPHARVEPGLGQPIGPSV